MNEMLSFTPSEMASSIIEMAWNLSDRADEMLAKSTIERVITQSQFNLPLKSEGSSAFRYESIGDFAFAYCESLTSLELSDCRSIGMAAFYSCANLSKIYLSNCNCIHDFAFAECPNLTDVVCSQCGYGISYSLINSFESATWGVTYISPDPDSDRYAINWAFGFCAPLLSRSPFRLRLVDINSYYSDNWFLREHGGLSQLLHLSQMPSLYSYAWDYVYSVYNYAYASPSRRGIKAEDYFIGGVAGTHAFDGCRKLKKITCLDSAEISPGTFACEHLFLRFISLGDGGHNFTLGVNQSFHVLPSSPSFFDLDEERAQELFDNSPSYLEYRMPFEVADFPNTERLGSFLFFNNQRIKQVEAPSATAVGEFAFYGCTKLNSVSLPICTRIEQGAFADCKISSIYLTECRTVESYAFVGCLNLTSIAPDMLPKCETIGDYAFTAAAYQEWPNDGTNWYTFNPNNSYPARLTEIELSNCVTLGDGAFQLQQNLRTINLPNCNAIGSGAFFGCTKLETFIAPNLLNVSGYAFAKCSNLANVVLGSTLAVAPHAFYDCSTLQGIDFGACVTVGSYAFGGCINLSGPINMPKCRTIGEVAFGNCKNITALALSECNIGGNAFSGCTTLSVIDLWNECKADTDSIGSCPNLNSVYLHTGAISIVSHWANFVFGRGETLNVKIFIRSYLYEDFTGVPVSYCTSGSRIQPFED